MALHIIEIHPSANPEQLNTEWFVLANDGDKPFNTRTCTLMVHKKGGKKSTLGTLDPGFTLAPGERMRIVTGNPGRKAHGAMPDGEPRSYNLFLGSPVLRGAGTILTLNLRSLAVASAEFAPDAKGGVAPSA